MRRWGSHRRKWRRRDLAERTTQTLHAAQGLEAVSGSSPSSSKRRTCSCCFKLAIHAIAMFESASRSRALGMRRVVGAIVSLVLREHV